MIGNPFRTSTMLVAVLSALWRNDRGAEATGGDGSARGRFALVPRLLLLGLCMALLAGNTAPAQWVPGIKVENPAIRRAMEAVEKTVPEAKTEPTRPTYHFLPPAGYHNDPNGPIWHNGYYHLFYQYHPYTYGKGKGGEILWGHGRSHDLVHWEHLPPAIWPSTERNEPICASGSAIINPAGRPMIFYTSGDPVDRLAGAPQQWAALGDDDLIVWQKHPANPILTKEANSGRKISQWRDPFVFLEEGRYYMLIGARITRDDGSARACLTLYGAENDELTRWKFLSIPYEFPDPNTTSLECPGMFKMGEKWLLFFSHFPPPTQVAYLIGTFDKTTFTFSPEFQDKMEYGPLGMYAPAATRDPKGRVILWGWMRSAGWYPDGGRGWASCMTLPRILTLRPDGWLAQEPAPELQSLREEHRAWKNLALNTQSRTLEDVRGDAQEILAEFQPGGAACYGMTVRRSDDGQRGVKIGYDGQQLHITGADPRGIFPAGGPALAGADYHVPLTLLETESTLKLHVLIDRCAMEVYVNGRACLSRAIYSPAEDLGTAVWAEGGAATVKSLDAWRIKPIW